MKLLSANVMTEVIITIEVDNWALGKQITNAECNLSRAIIVNPVRSDMTHMTIDAT